MTLGKQEDQDVDSGHTVVDAAEGTSIRGFRFWAIIVSLLLSTFLAALDITALSTSQPTIASSLQSNDFTWIGASYNIASCAFVPWSGGLAHTFGRRPVLLGSLLFFTIGSAVCGAAHSMSIFILGRTFQGVGCGGILTLVEIVLADLVPLSERGGFQGAFGAVWALASAIGPVIGGAIASKNWRWIFFLNLFVAAPVTMFIVAFLNVRRPTGTMREKLSRMDWVGNAVFIVSIMLFTVGLAFGGDTYPWKDVHVLAPLIIGTVGLMAWYFIERSIKYPTVPFELLTNRTTIIGFFTTFIHAISSICLVLYWPAWLQAVEGQSAIQSSVSFFSVTFVVAPLAMVAGGSISALGVYKPQNVIAWVLMTLGPGLMMIISANSSKAAYEALPVSFAMGIGLLYAATVFPVLAPLAPDLAGHALAFLVFARSLGNVLGVTIGSAILTNELGKRLPLAFLEELPGGLPAAFSAITTIISVPEPLRTQVRVAYSDSFRMIWLVLIPFGAVGLIAAVLMKSVKLQDAKDETFGIKDKKAPADQDVAA